MTHDLPNVQEITNLPCFMFEKNTCFFNRRGTNIFGKWMTMLMLILMLMVVMMMAVMIRFHQDEDSWTALHAAAANGHHRIAESVF